MDKFVKGRVADARISATSLIFTLFGDTVSQHSGSIWLSSIIDAMALFGINERLVRTSIYRLVKDGLLESERIGRCSYYRFSDNGKHHAARAAERIYATTEPESGKVWTLAMVSQRHDSEKLVELRRGLNWLGFIQLKPGLYGHPAGDLKALKQMLSEYKLTDMVVLFNASPSDAHSQNALKDVVYDKWDLDEVALHYRDFCKVYRPFIKQVRSKKLSSRDSFMLRTMLIHEYRRVLLKDPQLPETMLPVKWEGFVAHAISKQLYTEIGVRAEGFIREEFQNALGYLPKSATRFKKRFGGLRENQG
ncbi:MAG: PaaX family transcriptional regulator C-terminal domain-containing protein [Gammaproteobacteria bacterium]